MTSAKKCATHGIKLPCMWCSKKGLRIERDRAIAAAKQLRDCLRHESVVPNSDMDVALRETAWLDHALWDKGKRGRA